MWWAGGSKGGEGREVMLWLRGNGEIRDTHSLSHSNTQKYILWLEIASLLLGMINRQTLVILIRYCFYRAENLDLLDALKSCQNSIQTFKCLFVIYLFICLFNQFYFLLFFHSFTYFWRSSCTKVWSCARIVSASRNPRRCELVSTLTGLRTRQGHSVTPTLRIQDPPTPGFNSKIIRVWARTVLQQEFCLQGPWFLYL